MKIKLITNFDKYIIGLKKDAKKEVLAIQQGMRKAMKQTHQDIINNAPRSGKNQPIAMADSFTVLETISDYGNYVVTVFPFNHKRKIVHFTELGTINQPAQYWLANAFDLRAKLFEAKLTSKWSSTQNFAESITWYG